jgi:hypothetical protein
MMQRTPAYPNVGFQRLEFARLQPLWKKIRDCIGGEESVKAAGEIYLPRPNRSDVSTEALMRYQDYKNRAVFYNVTRSTLNGLVGQVFAKKPMIKLPRGIQHLIENSCGSGVSLEQQSKKALQYTLAFSRCGLHVDYPRVEGQMTRAELEKNHFRPTINLYGPDEIINWRLVEDGAEEKLSLIVLYEGYCSMDDGFEVKFSPQFRVLRLDEAGEFVQEIWREHGQLTDYVFGSYPKRKNFKPYEMIKPRDSAGKYLTEIPFAFIGSENNDAVPDLPNFADIANLNLAHYRNSADYEESAFITGQPTLFISGVDDDWNDKQGKSISFGARRVITAPAGSSAELIQATSDGVHKEAMETKERQMVALGARLVEQRTVQRTAYEASNEEASKSSVLASTTRNVSAAYKKALTWCMLFSPIGSSGTIEFELNTDFEISRMSPEQQKNVVELWTKGALTFSEMRSVLYRAGTASIEEADEAARLITEEGLAAQRAAMEAAASFDTGAGDEEDEVSDDADS